MTVIRNSFLALFLPFTLMAAPPSAPAYSQQPWRDSLSFLQNESRNHEAQINSIEQRLENHEGAWELLREQLNQLRSQCDLLQQGCDRWQKSSAAEETPSKAVQLEIKQLRDHQNEMVQAIGQLQQQQSQFSKLLAEQRSAVDALKQATLALTELLQGEESKEAATSKSGEKYYKVQSGDSLEKVARSQNTTIEKLKKLNNISSDRIFIGQKLRLP